ncbi:MAG TPA: hypothetical protein PK637_17430, partial [Flavobacteriales bacterium]|nr:hypothetical protein [Flavobacteriales bacterium]
MNHTFYLFKTNEIPKGESGELLGTKFSSINSCEACGVPVKPIEPFFFKKPPKNKVFFVTNDGDMFFLSDYFKELSQFTGFKAIKAIDYTTEKWEGFIYLLPNEYFPKIDIEKSSGVSIKNICQSCKKSGFFDKITFDPIKKIGCPEEKKFFFNSNTNELKSDIYYSYEHYG